MRIPRTVCRSLPLIRALCFLLATASVTVAREEGADAASLLYLGPMPELTISASPPTEARQREIRGWIRQFAEIDRPGVGYSPSMSGSGFAPQPGSLRTGTQLLGPAPPVDSDAFRKVVEAGADALPLLLHHLTDPTPTRYTGRFGGMNLFYENEMDYNPVTGEKPGPARTSALSEFSQYRLVQDAEPANRSHTVSVGEVCFAALGQIVGRGFSAMRYQPSGNIYVNSPVHSPELAAAVRSNWSEVADRAGLFLRLRQDFATRPKSSAEASAGEQAGWRQLEAARRLLYYFPAETDAMVAARLREFEAGEHGRAKAKDGSVVSLTELAAAVGLAPPPETARVLVEWARTAKDPEVWVQVAAQLGKVDRPEAVRRTESFLETETDGRRTTPLLSLYVRLADEAPARQVLGRFLREKKVERVVDAIEVLGAEKPKWAAALLLPLLKDQRESPRWRVRVCDLAAAALADLDPALPYERKRELAARDAQLERLQKVLESRTTRPAQ